MSEKDIAERLRAAFVQHHGNKVGDPFVSQIAREIASVAAPRPGREVVAQAVGELGERIASASVAPPSVVGEVVEAARAYLVSTRTSADTRIKREFKAALSAYDSAPRYGVEEIARVIEEHVEVGITPPIPDIKVRWTGIPDAARAVLSLIGSGILADERARIRNEALEEARQACAGPNAPWREFWDGQEVYYACAAAIEALKTKD